jgi:DNA-binding transcriptional LysR family regulator
LVSTLLFGETLTPVSTPEVASQINNPDDLLNYVLIEPSAHETTWAHVLGLRFLPSATRVIKVESTLLVLELAANNGGIALARPPARDILVGRLGIIPCLVGFSIVGIEAYHILHYTNSSLTREAEDFKKWLIEMR